MKLRDDFSGATTELRLSALWEREERRQTTFHFIRLSQSVSTAVSAASQVQAVMFVFVRKPTEQSEFIF